MRTPRDAAAQAASPSFAPPRSCRACRAPLVFGAAASGWCFGCVVLLGRSLWLQWMDNDFLQSRARSRFCRAIEVPAHRGRIVDRFGDALAISTPVKSLWVFRDRIEATPEQLRELARVLETTPQRRLHDAAMRQREFAVSRAPARPETAERALALGIQGLNEQNEYRRYYPGGEVTAHVIGFTGDKDAGQEGIELAQQAWLGGTPGSRRVIINRRGDIVEDVAAIRAPQAGRDLRSSVDSRLQYLAFRELQAAVERNKAKAGGLVVIDAKSGEILALANWPTTTRIAATRSRATRCATARSPTRSSPARR